MPSELYEAFDYLTLPVTHIESVPILDSGASISIAARQLWEEWGELAVRASSIDLQFANGNVQKPIGLL